MKHPLNVHVNTRNNPLTQYQNETCLKPKSGVSKSNELEGNLRARGLRVLQNPQRESYFKMMILKKTLGTLNWTITSCREMY